MDKPTKKPTKKRPDDAAESREPAEKPISLHPLDFEEAVRDLLTAKPKPKGFETPDC